MSLSNLITALKENPDAITFNHVMECIEAHFSFNPTAFKNGETHNAAGTNNGSCKIFAFAKLQGLSPQETLACFGDYYRVDVLQNPEGEDHGNIRNFMKFGWEGIFFEGEALQEK